MLTKAEHDALLTIFHDSEITEEEASELWDQSRTTDPIFFLPEDHP